MELTDKTMSPTASAELARAAGPLPNPALWIPMSREMGDLGSTDDRADTDYYEFVENARRRAYAGR